MHQSTTSLTFSPDQALFLLIHLDREGQMLGNSSYDSYVIVATKDNTVWLVKFDYPREQTVWLWGIAGLLLVAATARFGNTVSMWQGQEG